MARPKLAPFVTQALITLYARITKLGWFEFSPEKENDYVFRNVIGDVSQFLQVNMPGLFHAYLAINNLFYHRVLLSNTLVSEFSCCGN